MSDAAAPVIGSIVWFSIAGVTRWVEGKKVTEPVRVTVEDLDTWFSELNLDKTFLPPRVAAANAFRSASSRIGTTFELEGGRKVRFTIEEVKQDSEQIIRHVLAEIVDERRRETASDKIGELRFNRGRRTSTGRVAGSESHRTIVRNRLPEAYKEKLQEQFAAFEERYRALASYRDDDDVRTILRDYVRSLNAISVEPSKGIYFVGPEQEPTVRALKALVARIGPGCSVQLVPLLNTPDQIDMLSAAFQEQIVDETRIVLRAVERYTEGLGTDPVSARKYGEFSTRYYAIKGRRDVAVEQLHLRHDQADAALQEAREAIAALADRVGATRQR